MKIVTGFDNSSKQITAEVTKRIIMFTPWIEHSTSRSQQMSKTQSQPLPTGPDAHLLRKLGRATEGWVVIGFADESGN